MAPRRLICLVAVLLGLSASAAAQSSPPDRSPLPSGPQALAHWEVGQAHYLARRYREAVRELEKGYALEAARLFLFAIAQAERFDGKCARANQLYRRFILDGPPAAEAAKAREGLRLCLRKLGGNPADADLVRSPAEDAPDPVRPPVSSPAPPPVQNAPPPVEPVRPVETRAWYRDPLSVGLLAGSALSLGASATFYGLGRARVGDAEDASNIADYEDLRDESESFYTFSGVGLGVGLALAAGATIRIITLPDEDTTELSVSAFRQGPSSGLVVGGRF